MSITGQLPGQLAAVIRAADQIDCWVRRRRATNVVASKLWPAHDRPYRSRMSRAPHSKLFPAGERSVWLSVGNCLRAQYDALAPPMPAHIAALVEQLEMVNRATMYVQNGSTTTP
jgi:hypothetical protein